MRLICLALLGVFCMRTAQAETVNAPKIVPGDTWVYRQTLERGGAWRRTSVEATVLRSGSDLIEIRSKVVDSDLPPRESITGVDWSRTRSVNGRQTVVNRPLDFPLSIGKAWTIDFTEDNPNRVHSREHFHTPYKVTGWEDVTVPAGNFHALKIESEGDWTAVMAPAVGSVSGSRVDAQGSTVVVQTAKVAAKAASGRTYKAFWYAPSVKRWVKSVEEYYDSNGQRNERSTEELVSFKPAQ